MPLADLQSLMLAETADGANVLPPVACPVSGK
jgi:hypothetical protein